jgi:hypothetical protein
MTRPKGTRKRYAERLTAAERKQIAEMYHAGVPQIEIAQQLKCEVNTVRRWERRQVGARHRRRRTVTDKIRKQILVLLEQRWGARRIADSIRVAHKAVLAVMRDAGIKRKLGRVAPTITPEVLAKIDAAILARRDFLYKIAKDNNVAERTVSARAHQLLGPAPFTNARPLDSTFSQIDARRFLSPRDAFLELVSKCINLSANEFIQQGRERAEVLAAKHTLLNDPTPIVKKYESGLREAVEAVALAQATSGHTVH